MEEVVKGKEELVVVMNGRIGRSCVGAAVVKWWSGDGLCQSQVLCALRHLPSIDCSLLTDSAAHTTCSD
jgi:hypothetical protein